MTNDYGLRHPGRREAVVAVAVAWLVLFFAWLSSRDDDNGSSTGLGALASSPGDSIVKIDVSRDVTDAQIEACSPGETEVLYSAVQKTESGDQSVLVLRTESGDLRLCDSFGSDAPSVAPLTYADAAHPVTFLSNGRQAWDCDGTRLAGFAISHWLSVNDAVDRVELRFVIDGATGPWFSSDAQHGIVHVHAWLSQQNAGANVAVQARVLDARGHLVPQSTLPTEPQPIMGCNDSTVQVG